MVGVFAGCCALVAGLARSGYQFKHDISGLLRLAVSVAGAMALVWLTASTLHWVLAMVIGATVYLVLNVLLQTVQRTEMTAIKGMLQKGRGNNTVPQAA